MFPAMTNIRLPKALIVILPVLTTLLLTAWIVTGPPSNSGRHAPCSGNNAAQESCRVRDVQNFNIIYAQPPGAAVDFDVHTPTVEEVLEKGLSELGLSPTHIAIRGTGDSDSVRCEWHGVARTTNQREDAIRFWLGIDENDVLPSPSDVKTKFMASVHRMSPRYQETWAANVSALASGGQSNDTLFLTCYIDYTVQAFLLGTGTGPITTAYDHMAEARSFELYKRAHVAEEFGNEPLMSEGEYQDHLDQIAWDTEVMVGNISGRHETVLFLAPLGSHGNVTVEAWQAVAQWDLQEDDDEVVHAVRFGTSADDSEHTQTLTNLTTRVTTAATTDSFADDRISSPTGLTQEYRDIGAYDDITPDDGQTTTFTPAQPPPMPMCASGSAVLTPGTARGLVHDCGSLLTSKPTLAGTGTLNWGTTTASASWDGVTISGTPSRVTGLALASKSLTGTIPSDLGELFELTTLNLSNNQLTGAIPEELELLHNLTQLRLTGNQLTGCIPVLLEDVTTNDLSSLNLLYCQPPAPENLTVTSPMEYSLTPSWDAVSNTTKYRLEYRPAGVGAWTIEDETLTQASYSKEGLDCDTDYQLRVSAYGSGTTYAAAWSEASAVVSAATTACMSPVFDAAPYEFTIREDAEIGAAVGSVSATDPNGDTPTYSITAGDEDGKFSIDASTGKITVTGILDYDMIPSYPLTVEASDGAGGVTTTNVQIDLIEVLPPTITVARFPASMEQGEIAWFSVILDNLNPANTHTLQVATDDEGIVFHSATCSYHPLNVEVPAGYTSFVRTVTLHACAEAEGTVTATLLLGDTTLATSTHEVTVTTSEVTAAFGQAEYSVAEDSVNGVSVTVLLSADPGREVTVPLTVSHEGGAGEEDYTTVPSGVTFSAGETSKSFQVVPVDDTVDDDAESIVLNFGTLPQGVTAGSPATARVTIQDNDIPPPVTLWTATMTVGDDRGYLGYSTLSGSAVGSLTDNDFTWEGTTYTVTNILYNMYFDHLGIDFSTELTGDVDGITLHLDDLELDMADSTRGYLQPAWAPVILDWDVGDTVEVSLVYTAS